MSVVTDEKQVVEERAGALRERVTGRALVIGVLTIVGMALFMSYFGRNLVKNYMPVAVALPFVVWLGINTVLKLFARRWALSRMEMLTVFFMVWLVGNLPGIGWAMYMVTDIAAPAHYASPENRMREVVMPYFPRWLFPEESEAVIGQLFTGVEVDGAIPWLAWVRPLFWWLMACLSLVGAGFFSSVIFYKQWHEKERLVFPMATFPMDMLRQSAGSRVPDVFKNKVFWIGFGFVAGIIGWNIIGYFALSLPPITLFYSTAYKAVPLGHHFPDYFLRVQPMIMGLAYLCPLDILFSFWFYDFVNILKQGLLNRTGFTVGLPGQPAMGGEIAMLESHGALVFLVGWSVWVARGHLRETLQKAFERGREDDDGTPVSYRTAWLGLLSSAVFLGGWMVSAGMRVPVMLVQLLLLFICFFGITKYAATTGFIFLSPAGGKGADVLLSLGGTSNLPPATQTSIWLVNSNALCGVPIRITCIPSVTHFFRMLGDHLRRHPLIWGCIPVAFVTGFVASVGAQLYRCYTEGGLNGHMALWDWGVLMGRVSLIEGSKLTVFDPQKLGVWFFGFAEAGVLTYLKARVSWWPFHPAAIALPVGRYGFCLLIVWLMKTFVIQFGGVSLYRRSLPFWYGAIVGYLFGIGVSKVVDIIWFPDAGHGVHGW